jgi:type IV pilus assembly protein PilE
MHAPIDYFACEWLRRKELPSRVPPCPPAGRPPGFTLIEILVVLAITAVLAAIAIPTYADHLRRGRITEALTRLADHRVRMEQFFLDHRRYDDGAGNCGHPPPPVGGADAFVIDCAAAAAGYVVRATGVDAKGMRGFVYTIDHADAHRTPGVPDGWVGSDRCWVVRRDGSCG